MSRAWLIAPSSSDKVIDWLAFIKTCVTTNSDKASFDMLPGKSLIDYVLCLLALSITPKQQPCRQHRIGFSAGAWSRRDRSDAGAMHADHLLRSLTVSCMTYGNSYDADRETDHCGARTLPHQG